MGRLAGWWRRLRAGERPALHLQFDPERCAPTHGTTIFLAYLAASRFADHIPYYREEDILARVGFSVHRATQWRWMRGLAAIVLPLVELMRQRVMQSRVQGIDETPCPLLCPELGRTRSAYLYA